MVMTSVESRSSSRLNLKVGGDWAVCGLALTNITCSSDAIMEQFFATLTAVRMLSPAVGGTREDRKRAR